MHGRKKNTQGEQQQNNNREKMPENLCPADTTGNCSKYSQLHKFAPDLNPEGNYMKKTLLITSLCLYVAFSKAQMVKVFYENKDQGFVIYADNYELYPVSFTFSFNLLNLYFSGSDKKVYVIPPKRERFRIGELTPLRIGDQTKFSYNFKTAIGDVTVKKYDTSFAYDLPFQKGKSYKVNQGYNGTFSHQNENALDFTMPEETEILAVREGRVVQIVQNNTESCPQEECKKYNNFILIMHPDGTFGYYAHIKYNGSKLKPGDHVKQGDVIAYSGNVGWSAGPHLHFACFLGRFEKWQTIETRFKINKGDSVVVLKEGNDYMRDY
ncbi:M23 family metallopeptidase [Niastella caeni]|uniref:M23 family metallopeptidase n=1 Tax=Niastella caeni TaxID=2569763 RepID=A0A4S8I1U5_9BACT|nr:M23 family metallopeptidase [Niastella caeni]THU39702.1 M23 family metallopeptidase [Niastella caeni]